MFTLGFGMPGLPEMLVILVVVLVLFGAKKIPELARSLGKATREIKEAKSAFNDAVHTDEPAPVNKANIAPPLEEEELEVDEKKPEEAKATSEEKSADK